MLSTAFNTLAKAKLVYNKQKELYKLVVAFNVHTKVKDNGDIVHIFLHKQNVLMLAEILIMRNYKQKYLA